MSLKIAILILAAAFTTGLGAGDVVINEVELNPPGEGYQWVELYNSGDEAVGIGGWSVAIVDGPWRGEILIEEGTLIGPGEFYVAERDKTWSPGNNGSAVLKDGDGSDVDATHRMGDEGDNAFTWSRLHDGVDTDRPGDFAFLMGSKGKANITPGI